MVKIHDYKPGASEGRVRGRCGRSDFDRATSYGREQARSGTGSMGGHGADIESRAVHDCRGIEGDRFRRIVFTGLSRGEVGALGFEP